MERGIINENEFYTNHFWDSKLAGDIESRLEQLSTAQDQINALKSLEGQFWRFKSTWKENVSSVQELSNLYDLIFKSLGYAPCWQKRLSLNGETFASFVCDVKGEEQHILGFLLDHVESGDFESKSVLSLSLEGEEASDERSISEVLCEELFEVEKPPRWILLGAPNALFLIERSKWNMGRYLCFDWEEIFFQREAKVYREVVGLVSRAILNPDSGSSLHDDLDESSHRQAFAVTTELRENVREAIELLINEAIEYRRQTHQKYAYSDEQYAQELAHDALFYVYRLIFLLYLEAQGPESELLPVKSRIFRQGYSLEKLIEAAQQDLVPESPDYAGTFFHESLERIFALIWFGFQTDKQLDLFTRELPSHTGFLVKGLKSNLFDPAYLKHLGDVKFRNSVLRQILLKLGFTRIKTRGRGTRGRVSYANLGINQLGAVYEGLLSYTGFFAKDVLVALKPAKIENADLQQGRETENIYLTPKPLVDKFKADQNFRIKDEHFVRDIDGNVIEYAKGSFIYRLAGRDRQKLASYYTPESLTQCTVKYALKVLFEKERTIDELMSLSILEPAMGSGAFLNEAVNQLSAIILEREVVTRSKSLDTPAKKQKRLYEIKHHLISHNVYGVDLNPTAIELARFSLWLNCIGAGKDPPDFTGRLKIGNSLIGARFDKTPDGFFPWLILDEGMIHYGDRLRDYDREGFTRAKEFRRSLLSSSLPKDHELLIKVQKQAESLFERLKSDNNDTEAIMLLKKVCDLWCSMFFVHPSDLDHAPVTHEKYVGLVGQILDAATVSNHMFEISASIANKERFFHWELEFPKLCNGRGFDLILANPPWVAVGWEDALYVSDTNTIPAVLDMNAANTRRFIQAIGSRYVMDSLGSEFVRIEGYTSLLETPFYSDLLGISKNTYKAFDVLAFRLLSETGSVGIIQEDGILEDQRALKIRSQAYTRYRYHFHFQNQFKLFADVDHNKQFSVNIFGQTNALGAAFEHIGNLFLTRTVDDSHAHNLPYDAVPLIKDASGKWETKGHRKRVVKIDSSVLKIFGKFLNDDSVAPSFLNLHSQDLLGFVEKIASANGTVEDVVGKDNCVGSEMFHETGAQDNGHIKYGPGKPDSIRTSVLSGPNIHLGNMYFQEPMEEFRNKMSYQSIDLNLLPENYVSRCVYQASGSDQEIDRLFPVLNGRPYRSFFRLFTRKMVNIANERCLFTVIAPPGLNHIHGVVSLAFASAKDLAVFSGYFSSLVIDAITRLRNMTNFLSNDFRKMPVGSKTDFFDSIARRALALNCLTKYYSDLWEASKCLVKNRDTLCDGVCLPVFDKAWNAKTPFREKGLREQVLIEIDALVALTFGLTSDELVQVYEILFPVLYKYDRERGFDRATKLREAHQFFEKRGW